MSRPPRRSSAALGALLLAQAAHSTEEYVGRLWETFPPARMVSAALSSDLRTGFLMANVLLLAFGLWCWLRPVRRGWPSGRLLAWGWAMLELGNAAGHSAWALRQGRYVPGLATAPLLLLLAANLAFRLQGEPRPQGVA